MTMVIKLTISYELCAFVIMCASTYVNTIKIFILCIAVISKWNIRPLVDQSTCIILYQPTLNEYCSEVTKSTIGLLLLSYYELLGNNYQCIKQWSSSINSP